MSAAQAPTLAAKLKEVGRHAVVYGLGSVAQSAVGFILLPVLTGSLSAEGFGAYSMILTAATVCSAIFYFGMTSALPRSYFDYTDEHDRRAVFTTGFLILGAGAALQAAMGWLQGEAIAEHVVHDRSYAQAIGWALGGSALAFVNQFFFSYLRILRKSGASVGLSIVGLVGGVGLTMLLLHEHPSSVSAPFEAITYSQAAISAIFVARFGRKAFAARLQKREIRHLVHFGIASVAASFGNMLLDSLDRFVIERHLGLAEVGVYSAAFRLGTLINIAMITPFAQIWSPMMLEYRSSPTLRALFTKVFSYFFMLGGGVLVVSALFSGEILGLLIRSGVDSRAGAIFLLVMAATLVYGCTNIVVAGLIYERRVFSIACVYYAAAAVKAALVIVWVPDAGIMAAALAHLLACLLVPTGIHLLARRHFAFSIEWQRLGMLALVCAAPLLYGLLFARDLPLPWAVRLAWLGATVVLLYLACFSRPEREAVQRGVRSLRAAVGGAPAS